MSLRKLSKTALLALALSTSSTANAETPTSTVDTTRTSTKTQANDLIVQCSNHKVENGYESCSLKPGEDSIVVGKVVDKCDENSKLKITTSNPNLTIKQTCKTIDDRVNCQGAGKAQCIDGINNDLSVNVAKISNIQPGSHQIVTVELPDGSHTSIVINDPYKPLTHEEYKIIVGKVAANRKVLKWLAKDNNNTHTENHPNGSLSFSATTPLGSGQMGLWKGFNLSLTGSMPITNAFDAYANLSYGRYNVKFPNITLPTGQKVNETQYNYHTAQETSYGATAGFTIHTENNAIIQLQLGAETGVIENTRQGIIISHKDEGLILIPSFNQTDFQVAINGSVLFTTISFNNISKLKVGPTINLTVMPGGLPEVGTGVGNKSNNKRYTEGFIGLTSKWTF